MADTAIAITAGSGTNVDTRTEGTNGNHRQVVVLGDPATNAGVAPVDATNGLSVNITNSSLTVASHAVTNAGTFAVQATVASGGVASGALASGSVASGAVASGAVASGAFASGSIAAGAVAAGATSFVKLEDAASADADAGVPAMAIRKATPANTSGTDGDYEMLQVSAGRLWTNSLIGDGTNAVAVKAASTAPGATDPALVVAISPNSVNANGQAAMASSAPVVIASNQTWATGMSPKGFVATFSTLTRPANTTAYTALDSISDNATAGSVTALSATVSDTNDDPITIVDILISSTDTGLAGKRVRAYLFNSDPTSSSGVGAGDNAAYSQKKAGYIGSFSGVLETGFSDGTVGRLVPSYADGAASGTPNSTAGGFIVVKPTSGAKTLYIQYQAVDAFTPSSNSTTIIGSVRGYQGRAS